MNRRPVTGVAGYWSLLRDNRDFRRLYVGQMISLGGDWFVTVPLLGLVLDITDSALMVSVVLTAQRVASFLFAPLAGVVADRFKRKHIMIASDVVRGLASTSLVFVDDLRSPALAIGLVAVLGMGLSFHFPASRGALPNLVGPDDLPAANVLLNSAWGMMLALGAALGGFIAAGFGRDAAFLVDAVSFGISAVITLRIRGAFEGARTGTSVRPGVFRAVVAGIGYARRSRPVLAVLAVKMGFVLIAGGVVTLFPVLSEEFGAGDLGTGILFAAQGIGAIVGPVAVERAYRGRDAGLLGFLGISVLIWSVGFAAIAFTSTLFLTAVAIGVCRIGGGTNWAFTQHGLQRLSSDAFRGRIFSFDFGLSTLAMSVSFIFYGVAVDAFPIPAVVLAFAVAGALFAAGWHLATRALWTDTAVAAAIADAEAGVGPD